VGGVFLGRSRRSRAPAEDQWGLVTPMLALAAVCVILGLVPVVAVRPALATATGLAASLGVTLPAGTMSGLPAASLLVGAVWTAGLGVTAALWYLRRRAGRSVPARISGTWGCAYARPTGRMQYTAGSFTTPLLLAFGDIAAPEVVRVAGSLETRPRDKVLDDLFRPIWQRAKATAARFRPLQQGPVTRYLQYIVLTLLLMLAALFASIGSRP